MTGTMSRLYKVGWWALSPPVAAAAAYGAARLLRMARELRAARAELASGHELRRASGDVEDLIIQNLSAVSLHGDLALRLLPDDPVAARVQIERLTAGARDALHTAQAVTLGEHGEHAVALTAEADGAMRLLGAAGIETQVSVDVRADGLVAAMLARALREGVTNVLRHSEARTCSIVATRSAGRVRLEIVNDGVRAAPAREGGLRELAELVQAMGGSVTAGPAADGGFRLLVEISDGAR